MLAEELNKNISLCKTNIDKALQRAGRHDSVTLVGATKTQSRELIQQISQSGLLSDVGENHVQEIVDKYEYGKNLNWHMIGQLQSNKVKYIIDKVVMIHSLDRLSLAQEIDKQAGKKNLIANCLVEINMASEISKGGIKAEELLDFAQSLKGLDNINVRGIMAVMPNLEDKQHLKSLFQQFKGLFDTLKDEFGGAYKIDTVSCGMTNDYELAVEFGGATMVRLGRILFGARA